ncbi:MAG TPA: DUF4352 domain-containing protein [Clostridiales bacterium]|nr:DUF4352 domain-containing protein [Clostridiales bacterium]
MLRFIKKPIFLVLLVFSISIFTTGCMEITIESKKESVVPEKFDGETTEKDSEGETESSKPAYGEFNIGDKIKMEDFVFVVNGTHEFKHDVLKPDPGKIYFVVDVTVENVGEDVLEVSPFMMFDLRDSEGNRYEQYYISDSKASPEGELAPGKKLRGDVLFEMAEEAKGLEFIIKTGYFKQGHAIVYLDR